MGNVGQVENVGGRPQPPIQTEASIRRSLDASLGSCTLAFAREVDPRPAQGMESHAFSRDVLGDALGLGRSRNAPRTHGPAWPPGGGQEIDQAPPFGLWVPVAIDTEFFPEQTRSHPLDGVGFGPQKGEVPREGAAGAQNKNGPSAKLCPRSRLGCPQRFLSSHPQILGKLNYATRTLWIL